MSNTTRLRECVLFHSVWASSFRLNVKFRLAVLDW